MEVVYIFSCKKCDMCYIGESKRALRERLNVHINNKNKESVATFHKKNGHDFDWNKIQILD